MFDLEKLFRLKFETIPNSSWIRQADYHLHDTVVSSKCPKTHKNFEQNQVPTDKLYNKVTVCEAHPIVYVESMIW